MANRGTKPKAVDDIVQLALFVDDVGVGFPYSTLNKRSVNSKEKANINCHSKPGGAVTSSVNALSNGEKEQPSNGKGQKPSDVQKQFERFIIRESYQSTPSIPGDVSTPVNVVQPKESGTSTGDLPEHRTIATQTVPCDLYTPECCPQSPCQNACCRYRVTPCVDSSTSNDPNVSRNCSVSPTDKSSVHDLTLARHSGQSSDIGDSVNVQTPIEVGDRIDRVSVLLSTEQVPPVSSTPINTPVNRQEEDSLLEYIDAEFETAKKSNFNMCADRRYQNPSRDQDKRIATLEAKYDRVAKRLDFVEKDHTKEICEIRAELRRQAYLNASKCSVNRSEFDMGDTGLSVTERRHSFSDAISPPPKRSDSRAQRNVNDDVSDDSVWDVEASNMVVTTQNTQGKQITTRATPFHVKEMASKANQRNPAKPNQISKPNRCEINRQSSSMPSNTNKASSSARGTNNVQSDIPNAHNARDQQKAGNDPPPASRPGQGRVRDPGIPSPANKPSDSKKRKTLDVSAATPQPSTSGANAAATPLPDSPGNESGDSSSCVNASADSEGKADKEQYSVVAYKNRFKKQKNDKNKKRTIPQISGIDETENKEMFVQGLKCADFKVKKDLEESVRLYCLDRGVTLVHQRVLAFKADRVTVGCKVIVRNRELEKICKKGFWPPNITIREWYDEPAEVGSNSSDDKSSSEESN